MRNNARVRRSWRDVSCNVGLQHVSVIIHFHWKSFLGTRMCYICCSMYVVIVPEEVWAKDKTRWKNRQKVTGARSLSLCCSLDSVKKKIKGELILYISGTWKKSFVHETRSKPLEIRDDTLRLCHAECKTDGLEVTVTYTGQNLKLNALRLGLKNVSLRNRLDNGQEEKIIYFFYCCLAWYAIYTWLSVQIRDPSRFDNSTFLEKSILFFTLYFSL